MPPAEPVGPDGYLVPSLPRSDSTGAETAARRSRSELEIEKTENHIKAGKKRLRAHWIHLI